MSLTKVTASMITGALVDPKNYGAVGNGTTDDTAAMLAAIATGYSVDLGNNQYTYLVSSTLTLSAKQWMIGEGAILKTNSEITLLVLSSDCVVDGINFLGNSLGGAFSIQKAISIDGTATLAAVSRTKVRNCTIKGFAGVGYYLTQVVDLHQGNLLYGTTITNCGMGIHLSYRGEYTLVTGCQVDSCTTGVYINGGNNALVGCNISSNVDGITFATAVNDAHGVVDGCIINHNSRYALWFDQLSTEEQRISNSEIYYGDILINKSEGVTFAECSFGGSPQNVYFQGSLNTYFNSCRFYLMPTWYNDYLGEASRTYFVNCYNVGITNGQEAPDINGAYVQVTNNTTQSLTSAIGQQVVPFDNIVFNAMTNNLTYTYQTFYNTTTYEFDVSAVNSPNSNFFCDVSIAISLYTASAITWSSVNVYLYDTTNSRLVAVFAALPEEMGTNPGGSWKVYTLTGRVPKSKYKVIVENNSGVALDLYPNEYGANGLLPFKAIFTSF